MSYQTNSVLNERPKMRGGVPLVDTGSRAHGRRKKRKPIGRDRMPEWDKRRMANATAHGTSAPSEGQAPLLLHGQAQLPHLLAQFHHAASQLVAAQVGLG